MREATRNVFGVLPVLVLLGVATSFAQPSPGGSVSLRDDDGLPLWRGGGGPPR